MAKVNLHKAKTHLSRLVDQAMAGEEVIIARNGKPLVRLVPCVEDRKPRKLGAWKGKIWIAEDRIIIEDPRNEVFVSIASVWEIAIKASKGKLHLPDQPEIFIPMALTEASIDMLQIKLSHAFAAGALPWHHKDPFDRMLIAQARREGFTVMTCDRAFQHYDIPVLWC